MDRGEANRANIYNYNMDVKYFYGTGRFRLVRPSGRLLRRRGKVEVFDEEDVVVLFVVDDFVDEFFGKHPTKTPGRRPCCSRTARQCSRSSTEGGSSFARESTVLLSTARWTSQPTFEGTRVNMELTAGLELTTRIVFFGAGCRATEVIGVSGWSLDAAASLAF